MSEKRNKIRLNTQGQAKVICSTMGFKILGADKAYKENLSLTDAIEGLIKESKSDPRILHRATYIGEVAMQVLDQSADSIQEVARNMIEDDDGKLIH